MTDHKRFRLAIISLPAVLPVFFLFLSPIFAQTPTEFFRTIPLRGFPLLIHKQKKQPVFPTLEAAVAFENSAEAQTNSAADPEERIVSAGGAFIENIPGDFVDIADSYLEFVEPVSFVADQDFFFNCREPNRRILIRSGSSYLLFYQDPYMLIVGNASEKCEIDLFYDKRPVPFSLEQRPKVNWWIRIYEYKSFTAGWIKFDTRFFFRNFNPRYLQNYNNRRGLTADYEKTALFKFDDQPLIQGIYWNGTDFNAFDGVFETYCLFMYQARPDPEQNGEYRLETLNVNPAHIEEFEQIPGRLRFGWRGETSTVILQLESDPAGCEGEISVSDEPVFYYETKKTTPVGLGLVIDNDIFLRAENYQELTAKSLFRHYYANRSERSDRVITYRSPEQYLFDESDDTFLQQDLKKWEQVFVHEVRGDWARITTRRIKYFGWVPVENLVYLTQKKPFPPFEELRQYVD